MLQSDSSEGKPALESGEVVQYAPGSDRTLGTKRAGARRARNHQPLETRMTQNIFKSKEK